MKKEQVSYDYGNCHVCGERMEEKPIKQGFWIKEKLILIEDIPAGVCAQCGEKVVNAEVGKKITALMGDSKRLLKARTMKIPVLQFAREAA